MNKQILALLIPIIALTIPVVAILSSHAFRMARLRLEHERLRLQVGGPDSAEEVQSLRNDVETMRAELTELQERVDFTERLLASPKAKEPGAGS